MMTNEMQCSDNGILNKMKAENLSEEMIARILSDLLIAAGDTVNDFENDRGNLF